MYTDEKINEYSKPLSTTEKSQCESTIRVVESILEKYGFNVVRKNFHEIDEESLNHRYHVTKDGLEFTIFLQGSYGNGTCVKQDSDVDIAMICESTFRVNYPLGRTDDNYGFINSNFNILEFKKDLCNFINNLKEGYKAYNNDKCIDFPGNGSSRKDMDIVPAMRYRDYSNDYSCKIDNYIGGVLIKTNKGKVIINYPEQSRINSVRKNKTTLYYYKKIVRILKNIKNDFAESNIEIAKKVSSYGLECLIYNVPNHYFSSNWGTLSLKQITCNVVKYLCDNSDLYPTFKETNEILNIFDNPNNNSKDFELLMLKIDYYLRY